MSKIIVSRMLQNRSNRLKGHSADEPVSSSVNLFNLHPVQMNGTAFARALANTYTMKASLRFILVSMVLLQICNSAMAQNLIFYQNTDSKSYLVRNGDGGPSQEVTDFFIRSLSQGSGRPLSQTEFILIHDQYIRATKVSPSEFQVYATVQGLRLTGDTRYRGFDLTELMKPSAAKFTLERVSQAGGVLDSWKFESVPLNTQPAVMANFRGLDSLTLFDKNTFRFRDLMFLYAPSDKTPFAIRTTLIDEYFEAVPELEGLYAELKLIDPENIEQLNASETDLRRLRSQIETIRGGEYETKLGLSDELDPAGYLARFREIDAFATELSTQVRNNKANQHLLYYNRGLAFLEKGDRPRAMTDLQTAIDMQPTFAPAHLAMARLRYQEGDLGSASKGLVHIFSKLSPPPAIRQEGGTLAATIYQNYLGNAEYALQQKRHENAITELNAAAELCSAITEVPCTEQLDVLYSGSFTGIYDGMMLNAEKSIVAGKAEQAINEALSARRYAQDHTPYVKDTAKIGLVLNEAYRIEFQQLLSDIEVLLKNNDIDGAEQAVATSRAYRNNHLAAITDDGALVALENKVADRRYHLLISEGKTLAGQSQWELALSKYEQAVALEKNFVFQTDSLLPGMAEATAKALLKKDLSTALELARSNRLTKAREMRLAIDEIRKRYALQNDPDIEPPYQEMKTAIFNQECTNAQSEFDQLVAQAESEAGARDYMGATATFDAALAVAASNAACGMDVSPAKTGKTRIAPAFAYQQKIQSVEKSLDRVLYREAVAAYQAAGQAHAAGNFKDVFGLTHATLFDYIQLSGRNEFVKYGVEHFAEQKEYDSAITLLKDLLRKKYPKGRLKPIMVRIGQSLAVRDFQEDSSTNPKTKGLTYTSGDKGLKKLYKAYCKQWKNMD